MAHLQGLPPELLRHICKLSVENDNRIGMWRTVPSPLAALHLTCRSLRTACCDVMHQLGANGKMAEVFQIADRFPSARSVTLCAPVGHHIQLPAFQCALNYLKQGPNVDSLDVRGVGCLAVGHHALTYCISSEQVFWRLGDSIAAAVAGVSGTLTCLRFEGYRTLRGLGAPQLRRLELMLQDPHSAYTNAFYETRPALPLQELSAEPMQHLTHLTLEHWKGSVSGLHTLPDLAPALRHLTVRQWTECEGVPEDDDFDGGFDEGALGSQLLQGRLVVHLRNLRVPTGLVSLELCEHTCLPDATMAGVLGAVRHTLERFIMRQSLSGPPQLHCLEPAGTQALGRLTRLTRLELHPRHLDATVAAPLAEALAQLTSLRRVSLVTLGDDFADADVIAIGAALGGLPALERLSLTLECTYNPRMAVFWRGVGGGAPWFPALRALVLGPGRYLHWRLRPDDAAAVYSAVSRLAGLDSLEMHTGPWMKGAGVPLPSDALTAAPAHLTALRNLAALVVPFTAQLGYLASMAALTRMELEHIDCLAAAGGAAAFADLACMPLLQALVLVGERAITPGTDEILQALSRCPALESLELRHFQAASAVGLSAVASDDAVPRLARLIVALDGSVSAGGLVELQRKRPKVIVAPAFS